MADTKAFAYVRVSGKGQVSGDGFPRQMAAIKGYATTNGYRIVETYREEGVTGTRETMDRPAWLAMMTALHADGVKSILVEKLDRLARDLMIQETCIADLRKHGFTLISVAEPDLMANDPTRVLMRQLMGAVAQYDKSQVVAKLRGARMRKKEQTGRCEGRKPYGEREGEQSVIGRMLELRGGGMAFDKIAERLNEEGLKPREGERWWGKTVNNILSIDRRGVQ